MPLLRRDGPLDVFVNSDPEGGPGDGAVVVSGLGDDMFALEGPDVARELRDALDRALREVGDG
jgi:hypothetical protein